MEVRLLRDTRITARELAREMSVTPQTVRKWMDDYGLPYAKPGGTRETTVEVFEWWSVRNQDVVKEG